MIVDELAALFRFDIVGLERVRRAVQILARLQKAILAVAAVVAKRLARVGTTFARLAAGAAALGTGFAASTAVITAAAGAASAALAALAAGFAKARQASINQAFVQGIKPKELAIVGNIMTRIGGSAKEGQKWVGEFAQKIREGVKDGGDWVDLLKKQGVRLTAGKKQVKEYSKVIDDVIQASDKIKDREKKRAFLTEALEGAPDDLIAKLLQADNAFKKWIQIVDEAKKAGGKMPDLDILNAYDITDAVGKLGVSLKGFTDAIGSGLMNAFAGDFRKFGDAIMSVATDENRKKVAELAQTIGNFFVRVREGGFIVLGKVADAIGGITEALSKVNEGTGDALRILGIGLGTLVGSLGVSALAAAHPVIAISTLITGLLALIAEYYKWQKTGESPLSGVFEALASAADAAKERVDNLIRSIKEALGLQSVTPEEQAKRLDEGRASRHADFARMKPFLDKTKTPAEMEQYRRANPAYADWERRQIQNATPLVGEPGKPGLSAKPAEPGEPGLPGKPAAPAKPGLPGRSAEPVEPAALPRRPALTEGYRHSSNVEDRRKPLRADPAQPATTELQVPAGLFDGLINSLQALFEKRAEMAPEVQAAKIANDKAVSNTTSNISRDVSQQITATATAHATFSGILDPAAVRKVESLIDAKIKEASSKLANSVSKSMNTATGPMVNGFPGP